MVRAALFFVLTIAFLSGVKGEEGKPFAEIIQVLSPVVEKLSPKAGVGSNERLLIISYLAKPYKVHDRSMTGELSEKTRNDIGPGPKGFVLRVVLQKKGEVNQMVTPQTLQEEFWKTDNEVTPIGGVPIQMFWQLSYGAETDPEVLAQIRTRLRMMSRSEIWD